MILQIFSDDACENLIGGVTVGGYKSLMGRQPFCVTKQSTKTLDEESVHVYQLYNYGTDTTLTNDPCTIFEGLPETESDDTQYIYFTTSARLSYRLKKHGTHNYSIKLYGFEYDFGNGFSTLTEESEYYAANLYELKGLYFRYARGAGYDGTPLTDISGGFLGIDVSFTSIGSPDAVQTARAALVISPDAFITKLPPEMKYKPTKNARRGGTGSGIYPNAPVPALPTTGINNAFASILGHGRGLTYYDLSGGAFEALTRAIYSQSFLQTLGGVMTENLTYLVGKAERDRESVCGVLLVPCAPGSYYSETNDQICLATKVIDAGDTGSAKIFDRPLRELDMGTFDLSAWGYQSYADIVHTSMTLMLPGYGAVNIDPAAVCGGTLHVQAVVDMRVGNILYRVLNKAVDDEHEVIYGHYTGCIGIPLPIGGASSQEHLLGSITSAAGSLATGISTGNPLTALGAIPAITGGITEKNIDKSGCMQPQAACMGTSEVRLEVYRNNVLTPVKYEEIAGVPTAGIEDDKAEHVKVKQMEGKLVCSFIDLSGISGATDGELEEIRNLVRSGIYV